MSTMVATLVIDDGAVQATSLKSKNGERAFSLMALVEPTLVLVPLPYTLTPESYDLVESDGAEMVPVFNVLVMDSVP
jgi:hypothetical protein